MKKNIIWLKTAIGAMLFGALLFVTSDIRGQTDQKVYLPLVVKPESCAASSNNSYDSGIIYQFDMDNPVRLASAHADKNLDLRSYAPTTDTQAVRDLVDMGVNDPNQPPQFATLFSPAKVPNLSGFYSVYGWNWQSSPKPGTRGELGEGIRLLGLKTTTGEALHTPSSGYDIGSGHEALVIYADENSIVLHYTREDSAAKGYTVHVDGICTDPNLLALYKQLDDPNGPRNVYKSASERPHGYNLPALAAGQSFGTAKGDEIVVGVVDSGAFVDPRSCNDWWQIRPGYTGSCK